jgi:hypothetical protein
MKAIIIAAKIGTLATILLAMLARIIFIVTLTVVLGYCVLNLGPVNWILHTRTGTDAHGWLLSALGVEGIEYTLDSLIIMSYSAMLPPSTWICTLLTRHLSARKSRSNRT